MDHAHPEHDQIPETTEDAVVVATTSAELLDFYSLTLSARGIEHRISPLVENGWLIRVHHDQVQFALREIELAVKENVDWPPQPRGNGDTFTPSFKACALVVTGLLALLYAISGPWTPDAPLFRAGAADATRILQHLELYRLLTAATLHADLNHLLGNCLIGMVLLHFYLQQTGNGLGLLSVTLATILANLVNSYAHGAGHLSVGFSTTVFATVGALCSLALRRYGLSRPRQFLLPLTAGIGLLAMIGSGGPRTDLGAHFFGLLAGGATGLILAGNRVQRLRTSNSWQVGLGCITIVIYGLAWYLALRHEPMLFAHELIKLK